MRIIGGEHKGRILKPPMKGWPTRPTTDMAREALFNILMNRLEFSSVSMLDLFAGTGGHCWEFLSRGCHDVTFVDRYRKCIHYAKEVRSLLGYEDKMTIVQSEARKFILQANRCYDYIFCDPPYDLEWLADLPDLIIDRPILEKGGLLVLEHSAQHNFSDNTYFEQMRSYGQSRFTFFTP